MPKFNFDYQHQQGSEVLEEQATSQPNKSSYNESPEDSIWAEILMKLPVKDAFKCKAVSKQWHSLISDPHFARCYLSRNPSCSISSPWALLKRNTAENSFQSDIVADHASSGDSNPPGFYVRSFFSRSPPVKDTFNVVGSSLELILCMATSTGQFFVCNPLNKQYKALPHPARTLLEHDHLEEVKVGFVVQTEGGLLVTGYTYKVVLLKREISNIFNLVTFSPETGEWDTSEADCPEETKLNELGCCVVWNRILHWLDEEAHNLVAIDPYRDTNKCRLIKLPESTDVISNKKVPADRLCQQSQGCLRYAIAGSFLENPFFKIWVLEDCNLGTWRFEHMIRPSDIWLDGPLFADQNPIKEITPLAFHPFDHNLVYVWNDCTSQVPCCNFPTRKLKVADGITSFMPMWWEVFKYELPPWPFRRALRNENL